MKLKCAALDGNGKQCRREGIGEFSYHGDGEIYDYGDGITWVLVPFCTVHAKKDETHKQCMRRMRREAKEARKGDNSRKY